MHVRYLRNRKHVPCFYRVIQTRVEVWENEKCFGNTSRRRVFPQLFRVLPNFHECLYNSIETRSTCFLFLLENNATRKSMDYKTTGLETSDHVECFRFADWLILWSRWPQHSGNLWRHQCASLVAFNLETFIIFVNSIKRIRARTCNVLPISACM